jgi:glycosyltransferase involved in cell wall biosynthesis
MKAPSLSMLPAPPPGKSGWPWTESTDPVPERMPDGRPWPRISVVTPSFNQASFLEATLRSVLLQGYPNLEYLVFDGGSADGSVTILRQYGPWLAGWISEADRGQSDAVNKGFARATGEIFGWLNSDDLYQPGALAHVGRHFTAAPECALLYGRGSTIDESGNTIAPCDWIRPFDRSLLLTFNFMLQPATFWRRSLWQRAGELDVASEWAMDWEWLIRATALGRVDHLPVELAQWRIYSDIKTASGGKRRRAEVAAISRRYGGFWQPTHLVYLWDRVAWRLEEWLGRGRAFRLLKFLTAPVGSLLKRRIWRGRYLG